MKIYFDTEFTGLHKNTTLISLGMVDENDVRFYAEFTDYDKTKIDEWINKNVINNLLYNDMSFPKYFNSDQITTVVKDNKENIKEILKKWLEKYNYVEFVSDVCYFDMVLLIDLFGNSFDLPNNVSPTCHDINQDIANYFKISEIEAFDIDRVKFSGLGDFKKHNALNDALIIKRCYEIIINKGDNK